MGKEKFADHEDTWDVMLHLWQCMSIFQGNVKQVYLSMKFNLLLKEINNT